MSFLADRSAVSIGLGGIPSLRSGTGGLNPSLDLNFAVSKSLDPRITFTRASEARYYDASTVALAEQNLLTESQTFDNGIWTKVNSSVTANSTAAPDGTTTADSLIENSATSNHGCQQSTTLTAAQHTFSVYVKPNGRSWVQLVMNNVANGFAYFDVTAGSVGTVGAGATAAISNAGGGWYRCSITFTAVAGTSVPIIRIASANGTASYAGDGTSGIYVWGAQLEQRSSVTAYTPTTTAAVTNYIPVLQVAANGVARFDHNPVTRESLGLLIEEQRTNLLTYSEQFDNAAWTKTDATVYPNATVAPDGTLSGDLIVYTTASSAHPTFQNTTLTSGIAYTQTVYVKSAGQAFFNIYGSTGFNSGGFVTFNLSTGTVSNSNLFTGAISSVGNGWYRCSVTASATSTVSGRLVMRGLPSDPGSSGSGNLYTGDGFSGIYIWGAQLEAGAFATSYIPTVASQVTRSADAASMTGTNFSSWYRQDEGSVYVDYNISTLDADAGAFSIDSGSGTSAIYHYASTGLPRIIVGSDGALAFTTGTYAAKVATAYRTNDLAGSVNGSTVLTDSSVTLPSTVDQLSIGTRSNRSVVLNGTIKRLAYYPVRLANATLQSLTA